MGIFMPWLCPLLQDSMTELKEFVDSQLTPENPEKFRLPRIGDIFKWKYSLGGTALLLDIQPTKTLKGWYILKWNFIHINMRPHEDVFSPLTLEEEYILLCEG